MGSLTGKGREVADLLRRRRVDIACVQETKWKGNRAKEIGDGYKILYCGKDTRRNGVGIIVSEEYKHQVIGGKVMSIKQQGYGKRLNYLSVMDNNVDILSNSGT